MASIFEKVISQAKGTADDVSSGRKSSSRRSAGQRSHDPAKSSGLFRILRLATVDGKTMERSKIMPAIDDRAAVTAYKVLRTRVLHRMRSNRWRNLIVTGSGPGEGKTLTACNLAVSIASDVNQSIFLVDLDLQRSSVARYFGLDVDLGIGDYLQGNAKLDDIVYSPENIDRIAIIPNRDPIENSSELLSSPRMKDFLKWLHDQGGAPLAIFDMPPVLACDDVLAFYPYADALLMIASEGLTERSNLEKSLELLSDCNLLGVVLNRSVEHNKVAPYY